MLCDKININEGIPGGGGFFLNHIPGTIELRKLKYHNQDYHFNFFQTKLYFFCLFVRSRFDSVLCSPL